MYDVGEPNDVIYTRIWSLLPVASALLERKAMNQNEKTLVSYLRRAQIENPSLSVVVPMYNAARFIRRTLASILSQKHLPLNSS